MSSLRRFREPLFSPFFPTTRFFDDFDFDRSIRAPYWADKTLLDGHRFADGVGEVVDSDETFKIELDVSHFRPEELKVNVVENELVVEGKHEEKTDKYGKIERNFIRKYKLPANMKPEDVTSELSKEGILTVSSIKKQVEDSKVRNIPIQTKLT
uniref:SHSP domain-containing protein n=1 Tax=Panagrolaimus superbus TaxID=310955 RepID=A0A914Y9L7_9BILA